MRNTGKFNTHTDESLLGYSNLENSVIHSPDKLQIIIDDRDF